MNDFDSILAAAMRLSEADRLRLCDLLSETILPEADSPLSEDWLQEIGRRVAEIKAGTVKTIPWSEVQDAALARLKQNKS